MSESIYVSAGLDADEFLRFEVRTQIDLWLDHKTVEALRAQAAASGVSFGEVIARTLKTAMEGRTV